VGRLWHCEGSGGPLLSRIKTIKRALDAATDAIDALDADLGAGRLSADDHARARAAREREAGRLIVDLKRAQRDVRAAREGEQAGRDDATEGRTRSAPGAASATAWWRSPLALGAAAVVLLVVGVGGGVGVGRWVTASRDVTPSSTPAAAVTPAMPAVMNEVELQALRQAAERGDAPIGTLLEFAHVALDQGRLGEAQGIYERVLAREPRNVEAITHIGSVRLQEGRIDEALAKVEEALRIDPRYIHALWDRTQYLYHYKRDYPGAVKAAEAFLAVSPEGKDADNVRKLMADARAQTSKRP
jgi:tetratricopeptide (TPR) repeat protein